MNKEYLKTHRYDWTNDPRKLKVNQDGYMMIPDGRCMCCGRIFLNGGFGIAFCRDCDIAMSSNPLGPSHDFDTWGNKIKLKDPMAGKEEKKAITIVLTARRQIRGPIEFDEESKYFDRNNKTPSVDEPHFVTGTGRIITDDDDDDDESDLYKMGLSK